jgi:hypothetical protein
MQPSESGSFLDLPKLCPSRLLRQRNSPSSGSRKDSLRAPLCSGVRASLPTRQPFQNGNSLRELIDLLLCVPAILTEPG